MKKFNFKNVIIILTVILVGFPVLSKAQTYCMPKQDVYILPVFNVHEFCFSSEIINVVAGDPMRVIYEVDEKIPKTYISQGIKGVLKIKPKTYISKGPGSFSNFFVDTKDGRREKFTFICVDPQINLETINKITPKIKTSLCPVKKDTDFYFKNPVTQAVIGNHEKIELQILKKDQLPKEQLSQGFKSAVRINPLENNVATQLVIFLKNTDTPIIYFLVSIPNESK